MVDAKKKIQYWFVAFFMVIFFSVSRLSGLITDYWWFDALGFSQIFLISLKTKIGLFFAGALIFFIFMLINILIASKMHDGKSNKIPLKIKLGVAGIISIMIGLITSSKWMIFQKYINQVQFGITDPIFTKDVAFYVFSLPFLHAVWSFAATTLVITTILILLDYLQTFLVSLFGQSMTTPDPNVQIIEGEAPSFKKAFAKLKRGAIRHVTILASFIFVLIAVKHYLTQYSIMYSESGIVVGAGYTDVMVFLPIIKMLIVFAIIITVVFYVWLFFISKEPKLRKKHIVGTILVLYFIFLVVGPTMVPAVVQSLKVSPNELNLEKPYIENNIAFTKMAYGLDNVVEKDFEAKGEITSSLIESSAKTIDNVRLLDWRPLTQTYKQTQEIRLYYDLSGIDIDRYDVNGEYTQVMIAPRELNQDQITSNAQTWVNLHMIYTHGFGAVVSPVNKVTEEGMPDYFVKDIPPVNLVGSDTLEITQPRVYYGEQDNNFVIVNTKTDEFDFPQGTSNQYINYDGKGGVLLDSFAKKLLMVLRFADIKILLSSDVTQESKIMFDRNIQKRISKVTPFFVLDEDPYLVINEGRLLWIQDAYTASGNYPYSQKIGPINYIRNSVKIVVDAYDGDVTYYISDVKDPLILTYAKIFPKQFKLIDSMPAGLREHTRYPVDLFKIQSEIYNTYHMNDSTVFYNKEDAWEIPSEIYGTGQKVMVEPYYVIIKLPGEDKEEFILMTSFAPIKKDNMIAWFAARSDGENYGKLLLYKFPKDKLVYGPLQIEAKFDQDSEISQQLTLWSQQGSRVTRGNLLVIPIDDSVIYIEPLYLQAEQGQLPQLKRVLVSDGEKVVMEETLDEALRVLFGARRKSVRVEAVSEENLMQQANDYYSKILDSMERQDWAGIGDNLDNLGEVLNKLND